MASSLEIGVRLVRQAVIQEAIKTFNEYKKSSNQGAELLALLEARIQEYEHRARIIDCHLLEQTDLKKLLRELDICNEDWCGSSTSSNSTTTRKVHKLILGLKDAQLYKHPQLVEPLDSLKRGRKADEAGDYRAALAFYEYGCSLLFQVLNDGTLTQRQEERARERCLFYHERSQIIRQRLDEGKRIRGGHVCTSSLSLDSAGEGKDSNPETEKLLEMEEIQSCCSNLGSRQTLNQSFEDRDTSFTGHMTTGGDHSNSPVNNSGDRDRYRSQDTSLDMDQSFEYKTLDRTHATLTGTIDRKQLQVMTGQQNGHMSGGPDNGHVYGAAGKLVKGVGNDLHGSLPVLYYNGKQEMLKSTHSLWTNMDMQRSCNILPDVHRTAVTKVPLADMNQEFCISAGSLNSTRSSTSSLGKDRSYTYLEVKLGRDTNDTIESELVNLSSSCTNLKDECDNGSDSGYSDPSPDVMSGLNAESDDSSRKFSPFSDDGCGGGMTIEEMERTGLVKPLLNDCTATTYNNTEIFPRVIIQNDGRQMSHDPFGRRLDPNDPNYDPRRAYVGGERVSMERQRSIFQNPEKDILISQSSRDNLAVLSADELDSTDPAAAAVGKERMRRVPRNATAAAAARPRTMADVEVYSKYLGRHDPIPSRALASRRRDDSIKKDGCFYLAAALDFCWCL